MKKCLLVLSGAILTAGMLLAQPANDNCSTAIPMNYADTEGELVLVNGDTRGATLDPNVPNPCSATWTADDVWFTLTTPAVLPDDGLVIRTYFGGEPEDIPACGMAFHFACDDSPTLSCFSQSDPDVNRIQVSSKCLEPNTTYYIRVWSGGSATDDSGTFRIGAYGYTETETILYEETWEGGMGDWLTFGTCGGNPDSNANAIWHYDPRGVFDKGAYANVGVGVQALTVCDGAMGVDSDFDDNAGIEGNFGAGRCPVGDGSQYILQSASIDHSVWGVAGIVLTWTQGLREFNSDYFVGYRIFENGAWTDWRDFQVNDDAEFPTNSAHFANDHQRVFMGGAQNGDSLQIRYVYNANYYYWAVDDIRLVEAPCVDMRSQANFYAIAPAAQTPWSQVKPWYPLNDIYNSGACDQNNVNLNFSVMNSGGGIVYDENLGYGTIEADSLAENQNFTVPVDLSSIKSADVYTGTYTVTSDDATEGNDFNFDDNSNSFNFNVTEGVYALETGSTRSLAPAASNYDAGAPYGYVYGCYYSFPKGNGYKLKSVTWGANNPMDVVGIPINLILYKWVDANENGTVESSERAIVGFAEVVFDGTEPANIVLETVLENFNDPGADIFFEDGGEYLMVMQYSATGQTSFFVLASEDYDYAGIVFSSDQAGMPTYASVLGLPADGNVEGIDYGLGTNFGFDIVPVMGLNIEQVVAVQDLLPADNTVKLYPNPVSDRLFMDVEFTEQMKNVQLVMLDATGKSVFLQNYKNMDRAKLEFDVTGLVPGAYMMHVNTEKGIRTVPFVVQK